MEAEVFKRTKQIEDQKHEIEQHEEKILEMDEFKTRFFANISHEFRSPLTIIHGISEELSSRDETGPLPNEKFKMISRNAKRLLELVNQLLDISKIISNKMKLELVETDIIDFIRTLAASFSSLAEIKAINYSYHLPIVPKLTWFDRDKIEKVLVNLLSNAFKFTAKGGRIILSADYANHKDGFEEMLEFYVADTGIGIPEEAMGKIFDRFYQVEESLKKTNGGAGIGLSLVKDLVQIMHGEITVNSKKGEGSIFNVKIPLGKNHLNSNEFIIIEEQNISPQDTTVRENLINELTGPDNQEYAYETSSSKPILLIVEDNKDIRIFLKDQLRKHFRILEANDGTSGLEMAFRSIPDLVITDLMMPHMSGSELCRLLKSDERTSHIPVVMLTAKVSMEDKLEGLETGADDYISKPFNMKELLLRVINLIDQRRRLREKFSRAQDPKEVTVTSVDERFLTHAISIVEHHIDDEAFDLGLFCKELNLSRSTLFRKLFALTNQSPVEFIRLIRLKRAANLLKQHFGSITKVALEVGFSSPSYFAKCFRKVFGISPKEYVHS